MGESRSVTARALGLLGCFDEAHPRLTLSELARGAGLPLSTAHRLLGELEQWQAVERASDGSYSVGRRLWQLGTLAPVQRELRDVALPSMQDLFAATQENVQLAVRQGTTALYVERIHGRRSVAVVTRVGRPLPLHATGVGKVLMAHAPEDVLQSALEQLDKVTAYTISERGRMLRQLEAVRRNGYALTVEEMTLGTCSVAVPITATSGQVVAALGLVTASVRRDLQRYVPALQVAASGIGRALPV